MTIRFKGFVAAAALTMALSFGAVAPALSQEIPPEQLALARKYVDLTNKAFVYETIMVMTADQTSKLLVQQNPGLESVINQAITQALDVRKGKNDDLFNQIARVYAVTFTTQELQSIVAFYESDAGQKLANSAFQANQDVGKIMEIYTHNFGTEFVREVKATLKAQGYNV